MSFVFSEKFARSRPPAQELRDHAPPLRERNPATSLSASHPTAIAPHDSRTDTYGA
jgi:hypothetical protein